MRITEQDSANRFLELYYGFCDSNLRSVTLRYMEGGSGELEIRLSARDSTSIHVNEGWVCVAMVVHGVLEMAVRENVKTSNQVVSNGINFCLLHGNIGVEFGCAIDPPQSLIEMQSSDAYAIGSEVSFEVVPY